MLSRRRFLIGTTATAIVSAPLSVVFPDTSVWWPEWCRTGCSASQYNAWLQQHGLARAQHRRVTGLCAPSRIVDALYAHPANGLKHPRLGAASWTSIYKQLAGVPTPSAVQRQALIAQLGIPPRTPAREVLRRVGGYWATQGPWFRSVTWSPDQATRAARVIERVYLAYTGQRPKPYEMNWCLSRLTVHQVMRRQLAAQARPTGFASLLRPTRAYGEANTPAPPPPDLGLGYLMDHAQTEFAVTLFAGSAAAVIAASWMGTTIPVLAADIAAAFAAGQVIGTYFTSLSLAVLSITAGATALIGLAGLTLAVVIAANAGPGFGPPGVPLVSGYQADITGDTPGVSDAGFQDGGFQGGSMDIGLSVAGVDGGVVGDAGVGDGSGDGGCPGDGTW